MGRWALILGILIGWVLSRLLQSFDLKAGDALSAAVTLGAAYWIQRGLAKRAELDRIPVDTVARSLGRIESLLFEVIDAAQDPSLFDNKLVARLRALSTELTAVRSLLRELSVQESEHRLLFSDYLELKKLLTDGKPKVQAAEAFVRRMRVRCLRIHLQVSRHVLGDLAPIRLVPDDPADGMST